jgi:murein hydrolase activator
MRKFHRTAVVVVCSLGFDIPLALAGTEACPDAPLSLSQPLAARRLIGFGDKLPTGKTSQGVLIESSAGATVLAPTSGLIKFAGIHRSFGLVIVLDIGCDREITITGVDISLVKVGDAVEGGSRLGTMSVATTVNPPVLYLELRENGRPVDPKL